MAKTCRPLPPELLVEMHKCLPLANAIFVLVNVSKTFVLNNSTRMRRNIQRIKSSLNKYVDTLVGEEEEYNREGLHIKTQLEWKPQFDALIRYGAWISRKYLGLVGNGSIVGEPENFVEEFLLHLANSRSIEMVIPDVQINFKNPPLLPTFLKQLFNENQYRIGGKFLFESVELKAENDQILHIQDGEWSKNYGQIELTLNVLNKKDRKNWFQIKLLLMSEKICRFEFFHWKMESLDFDKGGKYEIFFRWNDKPKPFKQNGNKLETTQNIYCSTNLDIFLRRGAEFSQFRHFKTNSDYYICFHPTDYINFLISYISNAKHPEHFLDSIDMNLNKHCYTSSSSSLIEKFWKVCCKGMPADGKFVHFENKKLHMLSAKITRSDKEWLKGIFEGPTLFGEYKLEFTLANEPTNGAYLFDFVVEFGNTLKQIIRIKIQKRKIDDNVELKCKDEMGKKRKAAENNGEEEEDGPTCSSKILKK